MAQMTFLGRCCGIVLMDSASWATAEAEGAIFAHSVRTGGVAFKKGRVLTAEQWWRLKERPASAKIVRRAAWRRTNVHEDEAAARLAAAVAGPNLAAGTAFNGRGQSGFAQAPVAG